MSSAIASGGQIDAVASLNSDHEKSHPAVTATSGNDAFDPEERTAFLSTFSLEEEKKILRKIDYHFLLLLGLMHMMFVFPKLTWEMTTTHGDIERAWTRQTLQP